MAMKSLESLKLPISADIRFHILGCPFSQWEVKVKKGIGFFVLKIEKNPMVMTGNSGTKKASQIA